MFFLRPPYSNLLTLPEINVWHVDCDSFGATADHQTQSLKDMLYHTNSNSVHTFGSRQLILYPYKLSMKEQSGIGLYSVSRFKVLHDKKEQNIVVKQMEQNTVVKLENASATDISDDDFKRVMALFGQPIDGRPNVYNFVNLLNVATNMTESRHLLEMVKRLGFPLQLIDLTKRLEVNMRRLGNFISFSTTVHFGAPEGQTRMEAASRPCFGYPLFGIAPLRDTFSPYVKDFQYDASVLSCSSLPTYSTAFSRVQGSVLYSVTEQPFDSNKALQLKQVSQQVQKFAALEVVTTYQSFYRDVIQEITKSFTSTCKPFTDFEYANYDVTSETKKTRDARAKTPLETQWMTLNKTMQNILVRKVFNERPFNLILPELKGKTLDAAYFMDLTSGDRTGHWFTSLPFYHCFQHRIMICNDYTAENEYYLLSKLTNTLFWVPKCDSAFKKSWKQSPAPTLLFDMMFSVVSRQGLLDTFNKFLNAFGGTTCYYDPIWLTIYVFYPITCISYFYREHYMENIHGHDIKSAMGGKVAPVKNKIMIAVKNVLLQEYFKTLVLFGNKKKFNHLPTYKAFHGEQTKDLEKSNLKELNKDIYVAQDFLEMLLLTLPEKLMERILIDKTNKFSPFPHCDVQWMSGGFLERRNPNAKRDNDTLKNCEWLKTMPTVDNFLPDDIIPSTVMDNEVLAAAYTTSSLTSMQEINPEKNKQVNQSKTLASPPKKKQKQDNSKDAAYVPEEQDGSSQELQDESEHSNKLPIGDQTSPTVSMVDNQILRLKIWLLHSTFGHMNTEIQSKKNIGVQIKGKHGNFATLLKLLNVDENIFEAQNYKTDSRLFPISAIEELETFYLALSESAPDKDTGAILDYDTHNFLLYMYSSFPAFSEMVPPTTYEEIKTVLATIKKERSKKLDQSADSPAKHLRSGSGTS